MIKNFIIPKLSFFIPSLLYFFFKIFFLLKKIKRIKYFKKKFKYIFKKNYHCNKNIFFNMLMSPADIEFYSYNIFLIKIFEKAGFKANTFSYYKNKELYDAAGIKGHPSLLFFCNIKKKKYESIIDNIKNLNELLNFKWENISCGKYAASSILRYLRKGNINFNDLNEKKIVKFFLEKSIICANASNNFIKKHKIDAGLFFDKGYVGEGELMEALYNSGKDCFTINAYTSSNSVIAKKYNIKENKLTEHPALILDNNWQNIKNNFTKIYNDDFIKKIESQYKNNDWYPQSGTQLNQKDLSKKEIINKLHLDNNKKTAAIFSHIFWDTSFFYGEDLYKTYEEWFLRTVKCATYNDKINWIIKVHPANNVKNLRDNIKDNESLEEKVLKKYSIELPSHIQFLDSNVEFNSYRFYELIDFCFTVRGTPGIECAMLGKTTVTAGSGRYDRKGFTLDFKDVYKYENFIKNLSSNFQTQDFSKIAKLYAYVSFFNKNFEFNSLDRNFKINNKADLSLTINLNTSKDFDEATDVNDISNWIKSKKNDFYKNQVSSFFNS